MDEKPIKLSPNTLNLFLECKRCFYLQVNRGVGRPQGIFPSLPGGMDGVLKKYFDEYRAGGTLPPIIEGKFEAKLINPLPKSLMLKDDELQAVLIGKLDEALDYGDETYAPFDYKTRGYPPKEEIIPAYQLQMDVYDLLLEKNMFPTRHLAYLAYFYPTTGQLHENFPFVLEIKELKTNPERAHQVFSDAVNLLREDEIPAPAKTCPYCAWARTVSQIEE
jgi:hypothetical protein